MTLDLLLTQDQGSSIVDGINHLRNLILSIYLLMESLLSTCNPSTFRTKYKQAIESVPGVRYLSPHSCRHTYVSQMQALGVDLATIQSLVGHADVDMTKHYLHVQDPIRIAAITKFDRAFSDEPETHSNIIDFMKSS